MLGVGDGSKVFRQGGQRGPETVQCVQTPEGGWTGDPSGTECFRGRKSTCFWPVLTQVREGENGE